MQVYAYMYVYNVYTCAPPTIHTFTCTYMTGVTQAPTFNSQPDMGSCKRLLGINVFGGPS